MYPYSKAVEKTSFEVRILNNNEEWKQRKLEILLRQKNGGVGHYREYLVNLYNYFLNKATEKGKDYCTTTIPEMMKAVYGSSPDHMANELVVEYKKDLAKLGYIKNIKEDGEWRTYIIKEIDF